VLRPRHASELAASPAVLWRARRRRRKAYTYSDWFRRSGNKRHLMLRHLPVKTPRASKASYRWLTALVSFQEVGPEAAAATGDVGDAAECLRYVQAARRAALLEARRRPLRKHSPVAALARCWMGSTCCHLRFVEAPPKRRVRGRLVVVRFCHRSWKPVSLLALVRCRYT